MKAFLQKNKYQITIIHRGPIKLINIYIPRSLKTEISLVLKNLKKKSFLYSCNQWTTPFHKKIKIKKLSYYNKPDLPKIL